MEIINTKIKYIYWFAKTDLIPLYISRLINNCKRKINYEKQWAHFLNNLLIYYFYLIKIT